MNGEQERLLEAARETGRLIVMHVTDTPKEKTMFETTTEPNAFTKMSAELSIAVEAFAAHEKARLLADRREKEMHDAVFVLANKGTEADRAEYFRITTEILAEYDAKREKAGL